MSCKVNRWTFTSMKRHGWELSINTVISFKEKNVISFLKINLSTTTSMKRSLRELLIDIFIHGGIFNSHDLRKCNTCVQVSRYLHRRANSHDLKNNQFTLPPPWPLSLKQVWDYLKHDFSVPRPSESFGYRGAHRESVANLLSVLHAFFFTHRPIFWSKIGTGMLRLVLRRKFQKPLKKSFLRARVCFFSRSKT